jgi:hypothetical protein
MAKEARGNFVVWTNKQKVPGDSLPHFSGRLSLPMIRADHHTALWGHRDKHHRVYLSGLVHPLTIGTEPDAELNFVLEPPVFDIEDVIQATPHLSLKPNEIILFTNPHKTTETPNRPGYFGRALVGLDRRLVEIGAWLKRSRSNTLMFSGATSYPKPKSPEPDADAPLHEQLDDLIPR